MSIVVEGLEKTYLSAGRPLRVLYAVDLSIDPGDFVAVIGPSGSGKTTLLGLLAGLDTPSAGTVRIEGRDLADLTEDERAVFRAHNVGFVFQTFQLMPTLTALENVLVPLELAGRADNEADTRARELLSRVGLGDRLGHYPAQLSGGEQQRVALARAMAPRPAVILMDEPFSGLDRRLRDAVRADTLAILREARATCLIVTHDPEEAMRMADRIALMRGGRLLEVGDPADLYRNPGSLFTARFFCELNEISGAVRGGRVETPLGLFAAPGLSEGTAAIVCIRPQGVRIRPEGHCIPGRIVARRSLGEVDLFDIVVSGLDASILARVREAGDQGPGDNIGVEVDPAEVLVFAATEP
jgi:iron(III) transport system ATP-binding protein